MTRRTAVALVAAMTTLVAFSHASLAKPKIAVLGLEVINPDGTSDAVTTNTATLFTKRLRQQTSTGPYTLAPNSKKDLLEMKLLSNCSDEGRGCMAEIGRELGADVLMYGKIEKRAGKGYHVNLKLLDTKKAEMINVSELTLPLQHRQQLDPYAGRLYAKMVGMPLEGSLLLRVSNTDSGTVYIDGQIVGNLSAGSAKIPSITEGQRTLVIESEGFSRYSRAIEIVANQELDIEVALEKGGEPPSGRPGSSGSPRASPR